MLSLLVMINVMKLQQILVRKQSLSIFDTMYTNPSNSLLAGIKLAKNPSSSNSDWKIILDYNTNNELYRTHDDKPVDERHFEDFVKKVQTKDNKNYSGFIAYYSDSDFGRIWKTWRLCSNHAFF